MADVTSPGRLFQLATDVKKKEEKEEKDICIFLWGWGPGTRMCALDWSVGQDGRWIAFTVNSYKAVVVLGNLCCSDNHRMDADIFRQSRI